jgi:hypothetical protein
MYVIKRDGSRASVSFDKITSRITKLCYGLDPKVSSVAIDQSHFLLHSRNRTEDLIHFVLDMLIPVFSFSLYSTHILGHMNLIVSVRGSCSDCAKGHSRSLSGSHDCRTR